MITAGRSSVDTLPLVRRLSVLFFRSSDAHQVGMAKVNNDDVVHKNTLFCGELD